MTRDELVHELLMERFGPPVPEFHTRTGLAPIADLLDLLKAGEDTTEAQIAREVS